MGPYTSPGTNCNFPTEQISLTGLNGLLCILPSMHPSQNDNLAVFEVFIPFTNCLLIVSWRRCPPKCPNLWCHKSRSQPCSDTIDACSEDTASQSSWYNLSTNEPVPQTLPALLYIQYLSLLNLTDLPLDAAALTENKLKVSFGTYN